MDAKLFHLPCHTEATIYFPQCISAFVGADITTALLASEICRKKETAILIDIGTNGEMALLHEGTLRCCSTAAGPAFEGAGLSCGMAGENGAIDHISVTDNRMQIHVIGEEEAKGICGSGIVDALSALKRLDIMDETGCLNEDEAVCLQDDVCITQKDIRMVQLAKSAVCAGAYTLLQTAGVTPDKINTLAIAGGFGSYLDLHEAAHIGLYPHELEHNAKVLGNAALSGASMILENSDLMEESEQIAKMCDTIDLSTNPIFMEQYIECMEF